MFDKRASIDTGGIVRRLVKFTCKKLLNVKGCFAVVNPLHCLLCGSRK